MRPESLEEASDWLRHAERDLRAAALAVQADSPLPDMVVYHAQQAAEKALKAFLAAHGEIIPRTHDLVPLVAACGRLAPELAPLDTAALVLSPYAMLYRYPPGPLEPPLVDAEEALRLATEVFELVRQRLPGSGTP